MGGIWSIPCIVAGSSDIVVPIHQVPLSQDCRHDVFEEQPAANTEKDEPECCHCFRAPRFSLHDARALELFYILTILILLFLGCMGLPNFIPIWTSGRCNIQYAISVGMGQSNSLVKYHEALFFWKVWFWTESCLLLPSLLTTWNCWGLSPSFKAVQ